jgi:hypothetical protein
MSKGNIIKKITCLLLLSILFAKGFFILDTARSANMPNTKVTLSTPRLSFHGKLASGNTVGASSVTIKNSGPSTNTSNLFVGEDVLIGSNSYEVTDADDGLTFQIHQGLQTGDETEDNDAIVARSVDIVANWETATAVSGGKFRVLVPAASANNADGTPDQTGWDGTSDFTNNVTLTCPGNQTGYTFGAGSKAAGQSVAGGTYHTFTCDYTGTGGVGTDFLTLGNQIEISGLINPSPASSRTIGVADQYNVIVQHLDGSDNVVDQTEVAVAVIEAVRITASVSPQISFTIDGVTSGSNVCDIASTSVATTATHVPLGELAINQFRSAAQELIVATNAQNGYAVTALAADQLKRQHKDSCPGIGDQSGDEACIPDSSGDDSLMTHVNADEWASTNTKGFAYSLEDVSANSGVTMSFEHDLNSSAGACGTSANCYRRFADAQQTHTPELLFSRGSVADNDTINVCYKAIISNTQEAGEDYSTSVTYRATATF